MRFCWQAESSFRPATLQRALLRGQPGAVPGPTAAAARTSPWLGHGVLLEDSPARNRSLHERSSRGRPRPRPGEVIPEQPVKGRPGRGVTRETPTAPSPQATAKSPESGSSNGAARKGQGGKRSHSAANQSQQSAAQGGVGNVNQNQQVAVQSSGGQQPSGSNQGGQAASQVGTGNVNQNQQVTIQGAGVSGGPGCSVTVVVDKISSTRKAGSAAPGSGCTIVINQSQVVVGQAKP